MPQRNDTRGAVEFLGGPSFRWAVGGSNDPVANDGVGNGVEIQKWLILSYMLRYVNGFQ